MQNALSLHLLHFAHASIFPPCSRFPFLYLFVVFTFRPQCIARDASSAGYSNVELVTRSHYLHHWRSNVSPVTAYARASVSTTRASPKSIRSMFHPKRQAERTDLTFCACVHIFFVPSLSLSLQRLCVVLSLLPLCACALSMAHGTYRIVQEVCVCRTHCKQPLPSPLVNKLCLSSSCVPRSYVCVCECLHNPCKSKKHKEHAPIQAASRVR